MKRDPTKPRMQARNVCFAEADIADLSELLRAAFPKAIYFSEPDLADPYGPKPPPVALHKTLLEAIEECKARFYAVRPEFVGIYWSADIMMTIHPGTWRPAWERDTEIEWSQSWVLGSADCLPAANFDLTDTIPRTGTRRGIAKDIELLGESRIITYAREGYVRDMRARRKVLAVLDKVTVKAARNVPILDFNRGARSTSWWSYRFGKHAMAWCAAAPKRALYFGNDELFRPYDDPCWPDWVFKEA